MAASVSFAEDDDWNNQYEANEPTTWSEVEALKDNDEDSDTQQASSPHTENVSTEEEFTDPLGLGSRVRGVSARLSTRQRGMSTGMRRWRSLKTLGEASTSSVYNFMDSFQPHLFLVDIHSQTAFSDLQVGAQNLLENMRTRDEQLKALVKDNLDRFIDCKDVIDHVYDELQEGPLNPTEGRDMPKQLEVNIQHLQDEFDQIWGSILSRQSDIESKRRVLAVLRRFQFLVGIPRQIKDSIARGEHERVVRHYKRAKALSVLSKVTLFKKILEEVDRMVASFRQSLFVSLENANTPQADQEKTIMLLVELDAEENPAWYHLRFKRHWIKRMLVRAYKEHTEKLRSVKQSLSVKTQHTDWRGGSETTDSTPSVPTVEQPPPVPHHLSMSMKFKRASMSLAALKPPRLTRRSHRRVPSNPVDRVKEESHTTAESPSPPASPHLSSTEDTAIAEELAALREGKFLGSMIKSLTGVLKGSLPDFWSLMQDVVKGTFDKVEDWDGNPIPERKGTDEQSREIMREVFSLFATIVRRTFFGPDKGEFDDSVIISSWPSAAPGAPSVEIQMESATDVFAEPCSQRFMREPVSEIAATCEIFAPLDIPDDHLGDLLDLRLEMTSHFVTCTTDAINQKIRELVNQEDWAISNQANLELDEHLHGHVTSLPREFQRMAHDMLKQTCGLLPYGSSEVSTFLRVFNDAFFGMVAGFADSLHHLAFDVALDDHERILASLSNIRFTRNVVLPSLYRVFKTEFTRLNPSDKQGGWNDILSEIQHTSHPSHCRDQLNTLLDDLANMVQKSYIRVESVRLAGIVQNGVLMSGLDWGNASLVGMRPYISELLLALTAAHDSVIRTCGSVPLPSIFEAITDNVLTSLAVCLGRIEEFNGHGVLQGRFEIDFVAELLNRYTSRQSKRAVLDALYWLLHHHPLFSLSNVTDHELLYHELLMSDDLNRAMESGRKMSAVFLECFK